MEARRVLSLLGNVRQKDRHLGKLVLVKRLGRRRGGHRHEGMKTERRCSLLSLVSESAALPLGMLNQYQLAQKSSVVLSSSFHRVRMYYAAVQEVVGEKWVKECGKMKRFLESGASWSCREPSGRKRSLAGITIGRAEQNRRSKLLVQNRLRARAEQQLREG